MTLQSVSSKFVEPATDMDTMASVTAQPTIQGAGSSNNTLDIVDEMVDRERRKNNIVVYNLPESTDRNTDIQSFKTLSNTVSNWIWM